MKTSFCKIIVACVIVFVNISIQAQTASFFVNQLAKESLPLIEMPRVNNDSLRAYYDAQPKDRPYAFAKNFLVDISPKNKGLWVKDSASVFHWFCRIISKDAITLNFELTNCSFPEGAQLFVKNPSQGKTFGPYTMKNVIESNLFVEPIPGDDLVLEFLIKDKNDTSKELFTISKVGHDFRGFYDVISGKRGKAGSCEVDVACGEGDGWENESRSVVKIVYSGLLTSEVCTGTLINNTANNELPYVLTANHCINNSTTASSAVFYFNYQHVDCGGSSVVSNSQKISGAKLLATSLPIDKNKLDFSLLQLNETPPKEFRPYYSGWSLSKEKVDSVVCIHHPSGDVKKISRSAGEIADGTYTENGYMANSHWLISKWTLGATEGGSSGSALFNQNHKIIGSLTGGESSCTNTVNDYYSKFYLSWNYFPDSSNQLKYWLDPLNKGVDCEGFDPLIARESVVTNVDTQDSLTILTFGQKANGGWFGYNDVGIKGCAERFTGLMKQNIYAIRFPIACGTTGNNKLGGITLKVWSNKNNKPDSVLLEHKLTKDSLDDNGVYQLRLLDHLNVGSDFFVGFEYPIIVSTDSLFLYSVNNRKSINTTSFLFHNSWVESSNLGLKTSLGIELFVTDYLEPLINVPNIPYKWASNLYNEPVICDSKELFFEDSISNFIQNGLLNILKMKEDKGYWAGTNNYGFMSFAEKILMKENKYITSIKIIPEINTFKSDTSRLNLCVWSGSVEPDKIIYRETIPISKLTAQFYNVVKLKEKIKVDSVCFVGFELTDTSSLDTFALYMGEVADIGNKSHSFFKSGDVWMNYYQYDIDKGLAISVGTCYSEFFYEKDSIDYKYPASNKIYTPVAIDKEMFIYPNPSKGNQIFLHLGTHFSKSVSVSIFDIYGRIVPEPSLDLTRGNIVAISVNGLGKGVYFVKTVVSGESMKPIKVIIQ